MSAQPLRLAVLISGTGSNLKTLIDARDSGQLSLDIVKVISNRPEAPGLDHARAAGIEFEVINASTTVDGESEDEAVRQALQAAQPELVLLAGYMRILGAALVAAFEGRMINQHPSLLPRYKGLHTYRRVLEAGDSEHGASVHFVTAELDGGPVIAQASIPVKAGDDETRLAARLRPVEHRLLVRTVELFTERRVQWRDHAVWFDQHRLDQPLQFKDDELHA